MDYQDKHHLFTFPSHLEGGLKIIGFPIDEVLPSLLLFAMFMNVNKIIAVVTCVSFFLTMRSLKIRLGPRFIIHFIHWYGDENANKLVFKRTPPATKKYWMY